MPSSKSTPSRSACGDVNPNATVRLVWTGTFFDPPVERDAAPALIDGGVDVVAQEQDSPAVVQAAEERGGCAISSNTRPHRVRAERRADHRGAARGQLGPEEVRHLGIAEETIGLSPISEALPDDVVALAEQRMQEIAAGEFASPIEDQDGNVRIPEGEVWRPDRTSEFDLPIDNMRASPTGRPPGQGGGPGRSGPQPMSSGTACE